MQLKTKLASLAAATLLSVGGILHIQTKEGYESKSYPDPATGGIPWTICWGHTGPKVRPGTTATREQCEVWLYEDLQKAEQAVRRHVRVPLRQGEYDAMVSFIFNVGEGNFRNSTLLRLRNNGQWRESCNQYPRWIYANKRIFRGLQIRRHEEQTMCLKDGPYVYYPTPARR